MVEPVGWIPGNLNVEGAILGDDGVGAFFCSASSINPRTVKGGGGCYNPA